MSTSLLEDLSSWCDNSPDDVALIASGEKLTVQDVVDKVSILAATLRARKIPAGSLVAISADGPREFIGLCAIQAIHAVSVVTPSEGEWHDSGATILVHDGRDWAGPSAIDCSVPSTKSWEDWRSDSTDRSDETVHAVLTSGTTGQPKIVELTGSTLRKRTAGYVEVWPVHSAISLFRISSIAGIGAAMAAMHERTPYVPVHALDRPTIDLIASGDFRQLSGAPNQVIQTIHAVRFTGLAASFDTILTAGAPQTPQFRDVVKDVCTGTIANVYGSTECGTAAYSVEIASAAFTGTPALRSEFQVVLDDGTLAQPGHEGDVRYRTPAQCTTYRADGVETPVADDDGWFYPGDRGFLDTKGNITITGRTSDIVNVAGAKVNPLPIESAVEQIDGVEDAACVPLTLPDGLTHLALAISVSNSVAHAAVVSHLESLPRAGRPNIVVDVSEVPRNRNGKIDRLLLSERLTAAVRVTPPS
ncbi:MAG: hypothetical protein RLZZ587_794 [Actinomycetota bacterium]